MPALARLSTTLLAASLATCMLAVGLTLPAAPAQAAGYTWKTVVALKRAKAQTCRDFYEQDGQRGFFLMMRHDGRDAAKTARSTMRVYYSSSFNDVTKTRFVRPGGVTDAKVTGAYTPSASYRVRMTVTLRSGAKRKNSVLMQDIPRC